MIPRFILEQFLPTEVVQAQRFIEEQEYFNLLDIHHFISEEDHNDTLSIRPIRILINMFMREHSPKDLLTPSAVVNFFHAYHDDIMEIVNALGLKQDEIEENFKALFTLAVDPHIVKAVNILDGYDFEQIIIDDGV